MNIPRLLIGATASGSGKTTITCGLLQALINRGMAVSSFKCGPDYIDPMFHGRCIGTKSRNLDLFFTDEETTRSLFARSAQGTDIAVLEGVMGFYDGVGGTTTQASSYHLAKTVEAPVVLVINSRGMSISLVAQIAGFLHYRKDSGIVGVILNNMSPMFYPKMKELIERELPVEVLGYLPKLEDCSLESRHLGLIPAHEVENLKETLQKLAATLEETVDIDRMLALAGEAPELDARPFVVPQPKSPEPVTIAVAQDAAFCFYYADSLALLEEMGATLVPFSPLQDSALPKGVDGLLLGGGYPELHGSQLSQNRGMLSQIAHAISDGMPTVAECGGFMYLHEELEGTDGVQYPMVGAVPGKSYRTDRLRRFGYATLTANRDNLLCKASQTAPAHEFHYWDSTVNGDAFTAKKPTRNTSWQCVQATQTLFAGYPHLYWPANPSFARSFVEGCQTYKCSKVK